MREARRQQWLDRKARIASGVCILCAVFSALSSPVQAEPVAVEEAAVVVRAQAEPREVNIGDPIRYTVEASAAEDVELIVPVLAGAVGGFTITDFGESPLRREKGRLILSRWYTLTTFATGDQFIPAPTVTYRTPGEDLREAEGNEVFIGVASLLGQDAEADDIRDVKKPETLPFDWRPYALFAGLLLLAGGVLVAFAYFLNRPRRPRQVPRRPPHEVALAALQRLRRRRLVEEGDYETYYVELSTIVRRYLEDAFSMRAPEMTTEEFLPTLAADKRLSLSQRRLLGEFLSQADLVKFARHRPSPEDADSAHEAARRLVEETRPQNAAPRKVEVNRAAA
jgi:hypothetical protein